MFQPLPTPYAASLPYGVGGDFPNYGFISSQPGPQTIFAGSTQFPARQTSQQLPPLPPSAQPSQLPQHHHQRQQHRRQHHNNHNHHKMDPDIASELAAQEAAARDYNPDHTVPLVSSKIVSTAITEEYAKADPIYVTKTLALPQTYSHYRQVRGDGNCGWRAIAFAYFEQLINDGDHIKVEAELARLTSLNNVLATTGGYDMTLVAELIDETFVLLRDIANAIANPTVANRTIALDLLLQRFNDPSVDAGIVYHLRLLAAASLRAEEATYAAFLAGGVDKYLKSVIEPLNHEIDHMGITLLVNILLKPADYVLEVAYLDRSPGSEVNTYRLPEETSAQSPPPKGVIRLLFRPDHYDIIYLAPPPPPPQPPVQVNRVTPYAHQEHFQATPPVMGAYAQVDLHPLSMIPGFGAPPPGLAPLATAPSPIAEPYSPLQSSGGWLIPNYTNPIPPPPQRPMQPLQPQPQIAASNHPVRFSKYNYPELVDGEEPTFQTQIFKNSAYNVAHYSNPNFQPEEYKPGEDTGSRSKRRGS